MKLHEWQAKMRDEKKYAGVVVITKAELDAAAADPEPLWPKLVRIAQETEAKMIKDTIKNLQAAIWEEP